MYGCNQMCALSVIDVIPYIHGHYDGIVALAHTGLQAGSAGGVCGRHNCCRRASDQLSQRLVVWLSLKQALPLNESS